jgi:CHASE1-domain containing sensor protein
VARQFTIYSIASVPGHAGAAPSGGATRGGRGYAVPIMYLAPEDARNRRFIGFDMASDPVRRMAMDRAELLARPVASGLLHLVGDGHRGGPTGFIMVMPVFGSARQAGPARLRLHAVRRGWFPAGLVASR